MKLRSLKHIKQEQQGWPDKFAYRTKKGPDYWYYIAENLPHETVRLPRFVSCKFVCISYPRQSWRNQ